MLQIKIGDTVKIVRIKPGSLGYWDARDDYIGKVGKVSAVVQKRKMILVTFDNRCQIYFKDNEVENV